MCEEIDLMLSAIITNKTKTKGHEETSGSDEYVYYHDCAHGFMGVCICLNSSNCIN